MARAYKVRVGEVDASVFEDYRLCLNPHYNTDTVIDETLAACRVPITKKTPDSDRLLKELADSIQDRGIVNPVFAWQRFGGLYLRCGTHRVYVAKAAGLMVPVVIADYENKWTKMKEVKTQKAILKCFMCEPKQFEINDEAMTIDGFPSIDFEA